MAKNPKVPSFKGLAKSSLKKLTAGKTKRMNLPDITTFTGPRTTSMAEAEGRLKIAAKSKAKKASLKKAVSKKKKTAVPFLNLKK